MGSWCAESLKDLQAWKSEGLPMTAVSDESVKMFDATLRQLVSWIDCVRLGGLVKCVKRMLDAEPDFVMGKVLTLGLDALGTTRSVHVDAEFAHQLDELCSPILLDKCTKRERHHALAVNYFANGEMTSACVEWEKILAEHPTDLLALKFAHDAYFFLGDNCGKRDSVARVLDKWSPQAPCYSYLHGMYAFGLEECGEYAAAERHAQRALALNAQDCWATHAQAHCFEMRSDHTAGIRFMESTVQDWSPCSMLACHNFWHNAVFYLERGDIESALTIFDTEVGERSRRSGMMLDIVDAASLLTRIELEGGREAVGRHRWLSLLDTVRPHLDDHVLAFNDAHIAMCVSRVCDAETEGSAELVAEHSASLKRFVGGRRGGDNWRITRDVGQQLSDAVVDFNSGRYAMAFERLYPIRFQIFRIGGSHAQRDVFTQLLINSALRSNNTSQRNLAVQLIDERSEKKTNSALADRLIANHKHNSEKAN